MAVAIIVVVLFFLLILMARDCQDNEPMDSTHDPAPSTVSHDPKLDVLSPRSSLKEINKVFFPFHCTTWY